MIRLKLAAARKNAGYTQKEVADILNVSNKTICSWENYKTFPKQPMIEKLCDLYGLTYDAIDFAP